MCVQNLKFVALRVPEIIGGTKKVGSEKVACWSAKAAMSPKRVKIIYRKSYYGGSI